MFKALAYGICAGAIFGTFGKVASWLILEWAFTRFPQDTVITWTSYAFGIVLAVSMAGMAYEHFFPKDDDDDE